MRSRDARRNGAERRFGSARDHRNKHTTSPTNRVGWKERRRKKRAWRRSTRASLCLCSLCLLSSVPSHSHSPPRCSPIMRLLFALSLLALYVAHTAAPLLCLPLLLLLLLLSTVPPWAAKCACSDSSREEEEDSKQSACQPRMRAQRIARMTSHAHSILAAIGGRRMQPPAADSSAVPRLAGDC